MAFAVFGIFRSVKFLIPFCFVMGYQVKFCLV